MAACAATRTSTSFSRSDAAPAQIRTPADSMTTARITAREIFRSISIGFSFPPLAPAQALCYPSPLFRPVPSKRVFVWDLPQVGQLVVDLELNARAALNQVEEDDEEEDEDTNG